MIQKNSLKSISHGVFCGIKSRGNSSHFVENVLLPSFSLQDVKKSSKIRQFESNIDPPSSGALNLADLCRNVRDGVLFPIRTFIEQ